MSQQGRVRSETPWVPTAAGVGPALSMAVSCEMDTPAIPAHGCGCCPEAVDMEHEATQQGRGRQKAVGC